MLERGISTWVFLFFHKYNMANETIEFVKTTSEKLDDVLEMENGRYTKSFIHIHDVNENDTTDEQLYIGPDRVTDKFNVGNSNLSDPTRKIGGLDAATIGQLKDRKISEILMDILRPDVVEPIVNRVSSVTISYSGDTLIEVGSTLPSKSDISSVIDDGVWSDETPYSGGHSIITLNMVPSSWGWGSTERKYKISGSVTFDEGGIPKDNFGDGYPEKQYLGGTETSNEITITSVYPIYINDGNDITVMVKHLVNYIDGDELFVTIPSEVEIPVPTKFMIQVPSRFTTFVVKKYNQLTNKYDIDVPMVFVSGTTNMYIREDNTYTNTTDTQYKINLKK